MEEKYKRLMEEQKNSLERERQDRVSLASSLSRVEEELKARTAKLGKATVVELEHVHELWEY